jgi:hypothetical protein
VKKTILVGLVVLGLVSDKELWAETYVSGNVSGNWTLAGSPYIVTADTTVQNGATLVIDPGVEARFATETSLICYGTLNAVGTQDGTITFTSDQAIHTAGHWKGIKLSGSGANGSQISYCDIGYAKQTVYLENVSEVVITHNYIHDNKGDDGLPCSPGQEGEVGCGIYLLSSTNNFISTNTISENTGGNGGKGEGWCSSGGSGGIGTAIYFQSSNNNIIERNTIVNNKGGNGGYGAGWCTAGGRGGVGAGIVFGFFSINNILNGNIVNTSEGGNGGGAADEYPGHSGAGYGIYFLSENSYENYMDLNYYNNEPYITIII